MIQDIEPFSFDNSFSDILPDKDDFVIVINGIEILSSEDENGISFPKFADFPENTETIYLFSVGDEKYFYAPATDVSLLKDRGFEFVKHMVLMRKEKKHRAFAAVTAHHIASWYEANRFCGKCGKPMVRDTKERMVKCEDCKTMVFPRLNPVIIVGIVNGDELLLTKYAGAGSRAPFYALVAGFAEAGETIEQTVAREVMEEVGLKVKNIRYVSSQPWALSQSLILGFFCDVDGSSEIVMDKNELSVAVWMKRDDIERRYDGISITSYLINEFIDGRENMYLHDAIK